jgi:cytochrome b6-f complex iron-sulfur subunit
MTDDTTEPTASAETEQEDAPSLDRRRFLNDSWKVLGVALVAEAAWTSYDILNPKPVTGFGGVVDAGPVADYLEEGTVRYFLNGRFYVTQREGALRALYQKCPHLGCRVPFCESAGQFQCPCHGSVYNIIGEYLGGPAPRGLDRFPIQIVDGEVMVDTSSVVEGTPRGVVTGPRIASGPSCVSAGGEAAAAADGPGTAPDKGSPS